MLIIDGDYPMAHGAINMNRDLTLSIDKVRESEPWHIRTVDAPDEGTMASLPEMRRGKIAAALVKMVACIKRDVHPHGEYPTDELSYAAANGQLAYYRILESKGETRILENKRDFKEHMLTWEEATEHDDLAVGMVLGMEGSDPILWPEQAHEWWEKGLRVASLSHYGVSRYSHGTATGTGGGLLGGAKDLLKEMESIGMILDLSHTSDESVRQELEIYSGPILASHQNCRALVPGERQFPDEQLKAIIERGGVIGTSMDTWMLYRGGLDWSNKDIPEPWTVFPREAVTLEDFVDHIDHVCQLAGNSRHAAIGGDTDGQGGRLEAPFEIDTVADYQKVGEILGRRGYSHNDTENVMYRNWQRFFETCLPD